jgi:hypothetical protein
MMEKNQAPDDPEAVPPASADPPAADDGILADLAARVAADEEAELAARAEAAAREVAERAAAAARARRAQRGLLFWCGILLVLGVGSLLLGQGEAAITIAFAGLFAVAHAADVDPGSRAVYLALSWIVPVGCALAFVIVPFGMVAEMPAGHRVTAVHVVGAILAPLAGLACLLTLWRGFADALVRLLFRGAEPNRVLRQAARVTLCGFLAAIPLAAFFDLSRDRFLSAPGELLKPSQLTGGLVGYVLLALGGVGWRVRRTLPEALERLGVRRPRVQDLLVVPLATLAAFAMNGGLEALQHALFPAQWANDRDVTRALVSSLKPWAVGLLGVSAGVGEEITLRGGLQPRLGIVMTSLFFAALHVQYSWYGMATIFLLGMGLGLIRKRFGTTTSILVHALYDAAAAFGS